jgi:hypothetical protein
MPFYLQLSQALLASQIALTLVASFYIQDFFDLAALYEYCTIPFL